MRLSHLLLPAALGIASALPAAAQGFNVDVGQNLILWPLPDSSYGAASGQTGSWTSLNPSFLTAELEDLSGAPSGVTLTTDASSSINSFPIVLPPGGDQALMEDFQWSGGLGQVVSFRFEGLQAGLYEVYTYAADPAGGSDITRVSVIGSQDPAQDVQGPWLGSHSQGSSYAQHSVSTSDGSLEIRLEGGAAFPNDRTVCNGIQLVFQGGLGSIYCSPAVPNTTGLPGRIDAMGSPIAAQNDLTLRARDLPLNQFAIFITGQTQGLVQGPGGSQGNLCIVGALGRYNGPGQLQNSGSTGEVSLALDLTMTPTPSTPTAILAGETWNWQAWYRDWITGQGAVSNFTDAISVQFQ